MPSAANISNATEPAVKAKSSIAGQLRAELQDAEKLTELRHAQQGATYAEDDQPHDHRAGHIEIPVPASTWCTPNMAALITAEARHERRW